MHIYILGICGTFMGSLAILAREMGYQVSGCDANVYPPMSTQLEDAGIHLDQGFDVCHLDCEPDLVIVGNAMSRGNPLVERVLNEGMSYTSGPQFLHDYVIRDKWVLAVAGTHGKTTTASMLAWILEYAGMKPGFLIGGVVQNFPFSARLGDSVFFVVEADEYDTAFFDKRSKFVHYQPRTLILNNLEFDHADIFDDLEAIERQFHHLLRIVPANGRVIVNAAESALADVIDRGLWSEKASFQANQPADWQAASIQSAGRCFDVCPQIGPSAGKRFTLSWPLSGEHNVNNALAAIAAAEHVGVEAHIAVEALSQFGGVKRRMEHLATIGDIAVYDDFAHHPTAIKTTLAGVDRGEGRLIAVIEPRSNTMRMGIHAETLENSAAAADKTFWFMAGDYDWALSDTADSYNDLDILLASIADYAAPGDQIVIMSNGGFGGLHQKLQQLLMKKYPQEATDAS
ncbi:UDP-N-acetylmuramate--L-alanyl-gamma-D-glutamyl-meso-2,6-diaminoheptandioate ligase [BD1-7 clade bacterium]|uniref:UDP-N-acetylmuramate--L-alanyl-gamma-D-glutamyl-meso-2,6-diaminoheptandioate ligase n=1 Tax=BD1-7 clade bacterium TaxID=2029982 RepID=A0A5S9QN51_9GAMM|nr:UDP-N-acetylmuramate--L-alanyl-gamma-D-glutamyl-meso-2,6-diaminoheptandioate ligase [BD1-7 clade bacterium]CAA0121310.1 UDP-N-acetylmuramate--L-alanyl-gamma-D-glutamyl-meso-2,6-diaminoheptandioate ligase [BD1-7 clade bacterium]